jgi:hypothetical protein
MMKFFRWFKKRIEIALVDEFLVEIWFTGSVTTHSDGTVSTKSKKEFILGGVTEISQNHIKGKTLNGGRFELKTTQDFDYNITQIK